MADRQVSCSVADETVILHLDEGVYYGLNAVGACIWKTIQLPCSVDQIVDAITTEFDVDRERCLTDVHELLVDLRKHGLITVKPHE